MENEQNLNKGLEALAGAENKAAGNAKNLDVAMQKLMEADGGDTAQDTAQVTEQVEQVEQELDAVNEEEEQEQEQTSETKQEEEVVIENEQVDDLLELTDDEGQATEVVDEFITAYQEKIKSLGFDGVKSKDEFIEKVAALKSQADKADAVFANDALREANEISKQGGDWKEYLGIASQDYDAIPDNDLLKWGLSADLNTPEEIEEAIEDMTESQKKREVNRLRKELKANQEIQKQTIVEGAKRAKQQYDSSLKEAMNSISAIDKVKVKDTAKQKVLSELTSFNEKTRATEFQHKYFLNEDGTVNFEKQAQSALKLALFDKVVAIAAQKGKSEAKKEVISHLSNVQNPKEGKITEGVTPRKELSLYEQELERLKKGEKPRF